MSDDEAFYLKLFSLPRYFAKGIHVAPGRPPDAGEEWLRANASRRADYAPRTVYAIAEHAHPTHGSIFSVYASQPETNSPRGIFHRFEAARLEKGWKFVAQYVVCYRCHGAREISGGSCPECGGKGWEFRGGEQVAFGSVVLHLHRFEPPSSEVTRPLYEALGSNGIF